MIDPDADTEDTVRAAVFAALMGTDFLPESAVFVTECVAIIGYVDPEDGTHGWSMVRSGSPWATRGLVAMASDAVECDYASGE